MTGAAGAAPEVRGTCERCGRPIKPSSDRRDWAHLGGPAVPGDPGGPEGACVAVAVRSGATLRVLLLALLAASVSEINVYDDGFEITGPQDRSLVFVRGALTPTEVAAALGVPDDAVEDLRESPPPPSVADGENWRRHHLSIVGEATTWWCRAAPDVDDDLSDHFWLSALGVAVLVRRRPDGVFVSVEDEDIDPEHGPLLVQVNESGAVQYGEDPRRD